MSVSDAAAFSQTASILAALQWSDTAFPSGMYTLSHGLEGLSQAGWLDAHSLTYTVASLLRDSARDTDARAAALSWQVCKNLADGKLTADKAITQLRAINEALTATKPAESTRRGSQRVGTQLAMMARDVLFGDSESSSDSSTGLSRVFGSTPSSRPSSSSDTDPSEALRLVIAATLDKRSPQHFLANQAVVAATIHHFHGIDQLTAVSCELYTLAAGACSAALRLRCADHISAQRAVTALLPLITECAAAACTGGISDIAASTPVLDIASSWHETAPARLFIN